MTQGIFEVKNFPKIFDSMGVRMVLQSQAPKRILWLGGLGPHKINPPSIHFIGGSEFVKKKKKGYMHVAACFCLVSPLDFQEQEEEQEEGVMANSLDLGQGKNKRKPRLS